MAQVTDPKSSNINKKVRIYGYILLFISLGTGLLALIPMLPNSPEQATAGGDFVSGVKFIMLFPICLLFLIAGLAVLSKANRKY